MIFIILISNLNSSAVTPYNSYIYDFFWEPVIAPQAYIISHYFNGDDLGVGSLKNPDDIFVTADTIYLLDSGNNRIIIMNENFKVKNIISKFYRDGEEDYFNNPLGIFVSDEGIIYVADTNNGRVVALDEEANLIKQIDAANLKMDDLENLINEEFDFHPRKLAINNLGRLLVLARNVYDGILKFEDDGSFSGFIGAPKVTPDVFDIFWMKFGTEEQRARQQRFLPIEYNNIATDEEGYILAVEAGSSGEESIKRLNPSGSDKMVREGVVPTMGDVGAVLYIGKDEDEEDLANIQGDSAVFRDIIGRENGVYSVLDSKRGHVFTYNNQGELLYVFGGSGSHIRGLFNRPRALAYFNGNYLVLDAEGYLTVFRPTIYTRAINQAIDYYNTGRYSLAESKWREVLDYNVNYHLAYNGIGRSLLRKGNYEEAMRYFKLGQDRENYSKAYAYYRKDRLEENLNLIFTLFIILIIFMIVAVKFKLFKRTKRKLNSLFLRISQSVVNIENSRVIMVKDSAGKILSALRYSLYVIVHPFDGFWDLKHEKRGNLPAAFIILFLVWISIIFKNQYSAFIFNETQIEYFSILREFFSFFIPFFLWCMVNWALTTLLEGKGTFKEVCIATSYALVPIVLTFVPVTLLSHILLYTEGEFLAILLGLGIIWSVILIFLATLVTHEYLLLKTVLTSGLIVMGMGVVLFLSTLFLTVLNQSLTFLASIYNELIFR